MINRISKIPYEDIIAISADLYKYDYVNNSEFPISNRAFPIALIDDNTLVIELLKEIKDLPKSNLDIVLSYTYGVLALIETKENLTWVTPRRNPTKVTRVTLRMNPSNGDIYLEDSGFYKANSNVKNIVDELINSSLQSEITDKRSPRNGKPPIGD